MLAPSAGLCAICFRFQRFRLGVTYGDDMHISLPNLTLGLAGLRGLFCLKAASGDHIPSIFRMLLSRARFFWGARSRVMKYAKSCPRASEGTAGRLASLSSLQSGNSSSLVPVRRNSENGWRVCGMSCAAPCHPSNSSVRSGSGVGGSCG